MMFNQISEITKTVNLPVVDELIKQAIHNYTSGSYDIVFDCSKSLVECCCRTILTDLQVAFSKDDDFQKILRLTVQNLSLLPDTHKNQKDLRESIAKAISGFNTIAQSIGELRNSQGIMAHGGDGSRIGLGQSYALLMINLSDAVSTFLLCRHSDLSQKRKKIVQFNENEDFNDSLDEDFGFIQIYETTYLASDILYQLDPQGYEAYLNDFRNNEDSFE